jgi:hypothetical protein
VALLLEHTNDQILHNKLRIRNATWNDALGGTLRRVGGFWNKDKETKACQIWPE